MTLEQRVLRRFRELTAQKQEEVLAFISRLQQETQHEPRRSLSGLWADFDLNVTEEDIADARRGVWGSFPRDVS
jgi:hypothetical protein